jgi:hypothetical protein
MDPLWTPMAPLWLLYDPYGPSMAPLWPLWPLYALCGPSMTPLYPSMDPYGHSTTPLWPLYGASMAPVRPLTVVQTKNDS